MRTIVWVAIVGLFASALLAAQARADVPAETTGAAEQCSADGQAGMRDCLVRKASESSAALKQAENKSAEALAKWDEDAKYIKAAKAKLQASNAAFRQFSQAQCAFNATLGGGAAGNALEIRRLACIADLNAKRADELTKATSALPMK